MGNCLPKVTKKVVPHPVPQDNSAPQVAAPVIDAGLLEVGGKFNPVNWQKPQVIRWLSFVGLEQYAPYFEDAGMPGSILLTIQQNNIENDLHIVDPLHQLSLIRAIDLLKEQPEIDYEKWRWSVAGVCEWLKSRGLSVYIPFVKKFALHGALLFSLKEEEFSEKYKFGSDNGCKMHLCSLLSAIRYEKKKALDTSSRFSFASSIKKDGTFGNDGGQIAVVQLVDPLANEDKKNIVPEWTVDQVAIWINDLYLGHLRHIFIDNAVHGAFLLELNQNILEEDLHLTSIQSQVIYSSIEKLSEAYASGQDIPLGKNTEAPSDSSPVETKTNENDAHNRTLIDEDDEEEAENPGQLKPFDKFKAYPISRHTLA